MGINLWVKKNGFLIKMSEKVILDERGRITIPKKIRDKRNFKNGEEFELIDEEDKIILKIIIPKQKTVKADVDWKDIAFFDAGNATFGD